jgi:hypothetical protein
MAWRAACQAAGADGHYGLSIRGACDMICLPWWWLLAVVLIVGALGFVLHFGWHWYLLSRPDDRPDRRR